MSISDSIFDFIFKIFGKRVVWWNFNIIDWLGGINTKESLVEFIEGMRDTYELDFKLFTSEGQKQEKLLEEKIQESKIAIENLDYVNKEAGDSTQAAYLSALNFEVYTKEMFEEEKKTFDIKKSKETLEAINQVIDEAKLGNFKHSLSKAMQRLEELTDFEMFRLEDDETDKNT